MGSEGGTNRHKLALAKFALSSARWMILGAALQMSCNLTREIATGNFRLFGHKIKHSWKRVHQFVLRLFILLFVSLQLGFEVCNKMPMHFQQPCTFDKLVNLRQDRFDRIP